MSEHWLLDLRDNVHFCFKYYLFIFNFLLWTVAIFMIAVGIWSWNEKDIFGNNKRIIPILLDPATVLIIAGVIALVIGVTGFVSVIHESSNLYQTYIVMIAGLLLIEITVLMSMLTFKEWLKDEASRGFQTFIIHYREDPDQQNLIDWIQGEWLECCGIDGPKDWDQNNYFNCSSQDIGSRESCGVPFSCCKKNPDEIVKNRQCGYDVRKNGYYGMQYGNKKASLLIMKDMVQEEDVIYERGCLKAWEEWYHENNIALCFATMSYFVIKFDVAKIINEKGCAQALEEWIERNLLLITTCAIISAFFKVLAMSFAQHLRADLLDEEALHTLVTSYS